MLSPLLAGEKSFDQIVINSRDWYEENNIELIAGEHVDWIDRAAKTVRGHNGTIRTYDKLLIATGSNPIALPLPGVNRPGVLTFRAIADVDEMLAMAAPAKKAVVIGGGLLGLEAAHGLNLRGMEVAVVHLMPTLMERQLDRLGRASAGAETARPRHDRFLPSANTEALEGEGEDGVVTAVRLKDGRASRPISW